MGMGHAKTTLMAIPRPSLGCQLLPRIQQKPAATVVDRLLTGCPPSPDIDELNPTVDLELLPVEPILQTLLRKPAETEVIITGRCKNPPAYFDLASIHSEMVCHKH